MSAAGESRLPARRVVARASLPQVIRPNLPGRGVYAAGGGLVSSAWRVVVDFGDGELRAGWTRRPSAPSYGPMEKETKRKLQAAEVAELQGLTEKAWRAPEPPLSPPIADYDEILIAVDRDDAFFLQGYGPIRAAEAEAVIDRLRALARQPQG
jgi:hypothetical protein